MSTFLLLIVAGVTVVAIRRLTARVDALREHVDRVHRRVEELEARLAGGATARPARERPADRPDAAPVAAPDGPVRGATDVAVPPPPAVPAAPAVPPAPPVPPISAPRVPRPSIPPPPAVPVATSAPRTAAPPPRFAEPLPAAARTTTPPPAAPGLEERIGAVWLTRVGLVLLAIGVAYFANLAYAHLTPWQKTAIAYAGALGIFAVGRVFERSLVRFARPLMIGGLALAYFVSYAAHFVPAMRCVSLPVALAWMTAGVGALFLLADRWRSQPAAGFAVFLGHTAAFVAATQGDLWAPAAIALLAALAVALHARHDWPPFSLFALGISYAGHLAWLALSHPGPALALLPRELDVNVGFLTSYYAVFCVSDLLWWGRRAGGAAIPATHRRLGRAVGPTNVLLYVSLVVFLKTLAPDVAFQHLFFFALAGVQVGLGALHRRSGNPDHVLYPALGAVFATAGFAAWLDALALNQVLALEAVVLLLVAHRTRVWAFHLLAQVVLGLNFVHYWVAGPAAAPTTAEFVGRLLVVVAYLVKSQLEEAWYGAGRRAEWTDAPAGPVLAPLARAFDAAFTRTAPHLAGVHAVAGAVMLVHRSAEYFEAAGGIVFLGAVVVLLAALAVLRASGPLRGAHAVVQAGLVLAATASVVAPGDSPSAVVGPWTAWFGAAAAWGGVAALALRGRPDPGTSLAELAAAAGTTALLAAHLPAGALAPYLAWVAVACVPAALHGRARGATERAGFLVATCLAAGPFLWAITVRYAAGPTEAMWWFRVWCVALVGAGLGARRMALVGAGVAALAGEVVVVAALFGDVFENLLATGVGERVGRTLAWWMPVFDWAVALAVLEGAARRLPGVPHVRGVAQGAVAVGIATATVALVTAPELGGGAAALWLAALVFGFVVEDRARPADRATVDAVVLPTALGGLASLLAVRWIDVPMYRAAALLAASALLVAAAGARRHAGFAAASGVLFLVAHDPIGWLSTRGTDTPIATLAVVVLTLGLGISADRAGRSSALARAAAAIAYLLGVRLAFGFAEHGLPDAWAVAAVGALVPGLLFAGRALGADVAAGGSLVLLGWLVLARVLPGVPDGHDPLAGLLVLAAEALVWERLARRSGVVPAWSDDATRRACAAVVATALGIGFAAVNLSSAFGPAHEWMTVGWAVLAGTFLALGFALESPHHRRVGLGGLALGLLRLRHRHAADERRDDDADVRRRRDLSPRRRLALQPPRRPGPRVALTASLGALRSPAGGIRYHWRALRHRRGRWQPFVGAIAAWLSGWRPASEHLVLVGPSAGWCLPEAVLARFATLSALEPDPLARWLFARRFPALAPRLRWPDADYLAPVAGEFRPERVRALVADFPAHAFLFCNVLGQLPYLHPDAVERPSFALWKRALAAVLADRPFASFHDRLSGAVAARPEALGAALETPLGTEALAVRWLVAPARGAPIEVEDHRTGDLFPGRPRTLFAWEIAPGWTHLVEGVRSDGGAAGA